NIDSEYFQSTKRDLEFLLTDENTAVTKKAISCAGNILTALVRDAQTRNVVSSHFADCIDSFISIIEIVGDQLKSKNEG
ncbi:MAG: hypothetical protein MHPSP_001195, partial [Paramarteilia canceri]